MCSTSAFLIKTAAHIFFIAIILSTKRMKSRMNVVLGMINIKPSTVSLVQIKQEQACSVTIFQHPHLTGKHISQRSKMNIAAPKDGYDRAYSKYLYSFFITNLGLNPCLSTDFLAGVYEVPLALALPIISMFVTTGVPHT